MRLLVLKFWDRIRTSFWFLPVLMASGSVAFALTTVAFDASITNWLERTWGWNFEGGAEGASAVLGTIASSAITVTGVVFSMTLVALSLASSQLGPRLLRNFMADTVTQAVLGTFVATFLYCLLVLRTVQRPEEVLFVPHFSVMLGVVFAVFSVGVLIYFIHHISVMIQANEVTARVGAELIQGIDRLYPEGIGQAPHPGTQPPEADVPDGFEDTARPIRSAADGYIQFVDSNALLQLAVENDLLLRLELRPGHYVVANHPLVLVWPGERVTEELTEQVNAAYGLGHQRTPAQDIEAAVSQLVEVAVRALSPGINDPYTAIACVDRLGSALHRLAVREMPSPYRYDAEKRLRVIAPVVTFPAVTDVAFNQIRQYSRSSAAVTIRLLEAIAVVAHAAQREEDKAALLRHAEMIRRGAQGGLPEELDREAVEDRYQKVVELC